MDTKEDAEVETEGEVETDVAEEKDAGNMTQNPHQENMDPSSHNK